LNQKIQIDFLAELDFVIKFSKFKSFRKVKNFPIYTIYSD